jgi:single-strand DNA-binding protein
VEFGLATNRKWTGQDGQEHDETCFVDLTMFGKRAETISKYLKKGDPLFVSGRLKFEAWQAQDGSKRSRLKVLVEDFQFVGGQKHGEALPATQANNDAEAYGDTIPF